MKSKAILCFALVLSGGLWGCASADSQPKPDLAAFRIEQGPHEKSASNESADWIEWRNVLILTNAGIRVPLARSAIATFGDVSEKHGFDPGTLKLQWLKQDELLWISWTTFHLGSGGYTHNGNVILQIQGNRSHELFRDYFLSVAKAGWGAQNYASLKITYNDSDRILAPQHGDKR